jgi:chromosome segregation ATPase
MDKQTLEISEYVALAGSALGSVVAAVSGQAIFAAAPLTLALSLNLANRRRVDQEIQQYTTEALTQAYQVVQSLQQEVQALPAINRRLSDLDQQFYTRPETQSIGALEGTITQLKEQLEEMGSRLAQPSTSPDIDLGGVEQAIGYINNQLEDLTLRFDQLPTATGFDLPEIEQAITYINSQLETLTFRLDQLSTPQEADLSGVEQAFADIQAQLNAVTQRLDEVATPQALTWVALNR